MLRSESEVFAEFAKDYDGPTVDIDGYDYVPWPQVVRILDAVVGPGNWSDRIVFHEYNYDKGMYTTGVELTIVVKDDEMGGSKEITHFGVSTQVAQATKREREDHGLVISKMPKTHETAIDGSASLARTKASKAFGNRFGLKMYKHSEEFGEAASEDKSAPRKQAGTDSKKTGNYKPDPSKGISEAQINLLVKNGATRAEVEGMNQAEASAAIDAMKANGWKFVRPNGKAPSATVTPDDFEEEVNF